MACCAIFVFLFGGFVGLYRWLFRRRAVATFAPPARRAGPGMVLSAPATAHPHIARNALPWRLGAALLLSAIVVVFASWQLPAASPAASAKAGWPQAAPYSPAWCQIICSPLCPPRTNIVHSPAKELMP